MTNLADVEKRIREFRKRQSEQDLQMRIAFASIASMEADLKQAINKIEVLEGKIIALSRRVP